MPVASDRQEKSFSNSEFINLDNIVNCFPPAVMLTHEDLAQ